MQVLGVQAYSQTRIRGWLSVPVQTKTAHHPARSSWINARHNKPAPISLLSLLHSLLGSVRSLHTPQDTLSIGVSRSRSSATHRRAPSPPVRTEEGYRALRTLLAPNSRPNGRGSRSYSQPGGNRSPTTKNNYTRAPSPPPRRWGRLYFTFHFSHRRLRDPPRDYALSPQRYRDSRPCQPRRAKPASPPQHPRHRRLPPARLGEQPPRCALLLAPHAGSHGNSLRRRNPPGLPVIKLLIPEEPGRT